MKNPHLVKLVYSAVCLALALVLPFITGQIPQIGDMLCPMHLPVLLCGFLCGWQYGLLVGAVAPLLRSSIFGMPHMFPTAAAMTFELAAYGALAGIFYRLLPKKTGYIYVSLLAAQLGGRIVWGPVRYFFTGLAGKEFPMSAFIAGAFTNAAAGIIVQIIIVPLIVLAMQKAKLIPSSK